MWFKRNRSWRRQGDVLYALNNIIRAVIATLLIGWHHVTIYTANSRIPISFVGPPLTYVRINIKVLFNLRSMAAIITPKENRVNLWGSDIEMGDAWSCHSFLYNWFVSQSSISCMLMQMRIMLTWLAWIKQITPVRMIT